MRRHGTVRVKQRDEVHRAFITSTSPLTTCRCLPTGRRPLAEGEEEDGYFNIQVDGRSSEFVTLSVSEESVFSAPEQESLRAKPARSRFSKGSTSSFSLPGLVSLLAERGNGERFHRNLNT